MPSRERWLYMACRVVPVVPLLYKTYTRARARVIETTGTTGTTGIVLCARGNEAPKAQSFRYIGYPRKGARHKTAKPESPEVPDRCA